MALDFPNSPTLNQTFTSPNGTIWMWDGVKWVAITSTSAYTGNTNVGRSYIHNGLFNVAQRGAGPFTASGVTLDRWSAIITTDTVSFAQATLAAADRAAIGDESGSGCLQNTFTGNAAAGAFHMLTQRIEDVRRLANKTVIVSFYAAANATLKLGINITQSPGTGGSPAGGGRFATGTQVTITTAWARYTVPFTLSSLTTMTVGTNSDHYTGVEFWFSSGANANAMAGNVGVQSGIVKLWGVQLEVGSVATPLEKPDPQQDLAKCQRYYQLGQFVVGSYATAGQHVYASQGLVVTMRASPTFTPGTLANSNLTSATPLADITKIFMDCVVTSAAPWLLNYAYTLSADL